MYLISCSMSCYLLVRGVVTYVVEVVPVLKGPDAVAEDDDKDGMDQVGTVA